MKRDEELFLRLGPNIQKMNAKTADLKTLENAGKERGIKGSPET